MNINKDQIKIVRKMLLPAPPLFIQWLDRMVMLLPRKFQPVNLLPDGNVEIINSYNGDYHAKKENAYFQIYAESTRQSAGWFYLEVALVRHGGNRIAKIYTDLGRGFCEQDSIFIPSNRRGTIGEVVYLPNGLKNVRWVPMETAGRFTQSALIFHRITRLESFIRRTYRVYSDIWRFRHLSLTERSGVNWLSPLTNLTESYEWTANLRKANANIISYSEFIRRNDAVTVDDLIVVNKHIPQLPVKPLLSIIMPVYNPYVEFFIAALDSVLAQHYPYWELCIADDASTDSRISEIIKSYMQQDSRIKAVFRPDNGDICAALNSALTLATGDFIVLLTQDDLIPSHSLYHVAVEINRYPDVQLIYSDEDKINEFGHRVDPHFKSDWNPDLFYSLNIFSHLGVYRTELVHKVGGFRLGYEGAQDYDLVLRCIKSINADSIRHIPRILYHWRVHTSSTVLSHANKDYASLAGYRALQNYFSESLIKVDTTDVMGTYRTRYPLPDKLPLVSLIIPTRDQVDVLRKCIESLQNKTAYLNFEVLVLDNQSQEPSTLAYLASLSQDNRFKVIPYNFPFNYSAINNYAVSLAQGEIIGLINNDIEVINSDWLHEMVSHAVRPGVGAIGAKLLYSDNTIQHAGFILGLGGLAGHSHKYFDENSWGYYHRPRLAQTLSAVTAACLLVKKELFERVDGLDEQNLTVAFNDVDFCIKLREAGFRNIYTPYAKLYHHESISRGQENSPEKQARFLSEVAFMQKKWGDILKNDPYYNPNLTHDREDFSLANHDVKSPHHGYPLTVSV